MAVSATKADDNCATYRDILDHAIDERPLNELDMSNQERLEVLLRSYLTDPVIQHMMVMEAIEALIGKSVTDTGNQHLISFKQGLEHLQMMLNLLLPGYDSPAISQRAPFSILNVIDNMQALNALLKCIDELSFFVIPAAFRPTEEYLRELNAKHHYARAAKVTIRRTPPSPMR